MMEKKVSLKQLGESVTNYVDRLKGDPLSRTEFTIIVSLFVLCIVNIVVVGLAVQYSNLISVDLARDSVTNAMNATTLVISPEEANATLVSDLDYLRNRILTVAASISLIMTLILGYLVARIALRPTREAVISQKQFISNVAHELRTPLSIIRANNEILLIESPPDSPMTDTAKSTIDELDRVSGIINNLLTINAFQDRGQLELVPVDIGLVISDSVKKLQRLLESKKLKVKLHITKGLYAHGSATALEQIAINLIKNAAIYTPNEGSITVSTKLVEGDKVEVAFKDTGIGIEKKNLEHIFEPFFQADPSRTTGLGGRGLGLAIVSELVKLHKGKIIVKSTVGEGTTVRLWFPITDEVKQSKTVKKTNEVKMDFSEIKV